MKVERDLTKICLHVHIKDGKISNVFSHLSKLPDNCVVHLKPDVVLSASEFEETHPQDVDELRAPPEQKIFDLGKESYKLE